MVSRTLMGIWAALDFFLLASGAITIALSVVWRAPNALMNMVLSDADLTGILYVPSNFITVLLIIQIVSAGMILGIALLVTFAISIGGIVQRNHVTLGLVTLNWVLILDALGIIVIGTFVWFFTLQEGANYHKRWLATTPEARRALQDQVCPPNPVLSPANNLF